MLLFLVFYYMWLYIIVILVLFKLLFDFILIKLLKSLFMYLELLIFWGYKGDKILKKILYMLSIWLLKEFVSLVLSKKF